MGRVMLPALKNDEVKKAYVKLGEAMKVNDVDEIANSLRKIADLFCISHVNGSK